MSDLINFQIFKNTNTFQEKHAFIKTKELDFLSYYKDFKLLLCSTCQIAFGITSRSFKAHLLKHINIYSKEQKDLLISQAIIIFNSLEILSLKESLDLILLFSKSFNLGVFKELALIDLFTCNANNCLMILSSEYSIKRHFRENHNNNLISPIFIIKKGHALEINKFFFEINLNTSIVNIISINSRESSPIELNELNQAKEVFLANFAEKQKGYLKELSNFKLDPQDKLSPFQIKTRYIEYISKYNLEDLVGFIAPLSKEDKVLKVLVLNLKDILYLSLEKSIFLNKVHLNILNSFEDNKIRNKPFKPLLNASTRIKYFNFFSLFLTFFYRALKFSSNNQISYFKVDNSIVTIIKTLNNLVNEKINFDKDQEDYLELSNQSFQRNQKTINKKLNKVKINKLINLEESENENQSDTNSISNINSLVSNSISTLDNSLNSISSSNSSSLNISHILESSNIDILKKIQDINKSKDTLSLKIKELLLELIIKLFKQKTDLNIFDSSINSFFAVISIRIKDRSFRDSLELSQDYSKFIYATQVLVIEYSFNRLFKDNNLELTIILREFRDKYLNNSTNYALSEILNNRAYCFKVNKEISTLDFVSISNTKKETVSYKKVTLSVDNLSSLFKELISTTYNLLVNKLLFNISKSKYKEVTLEEFAKFEDRNLTTPFKCFRDLYPNSNTYNNFLKNEIFNNSLLLNRFFKKINNNLQLNSQEVKSYLKDILEFKKLCLLLIYLTTGLPLRGTELVTLRYLNSYKDKREIFLDIGSNLFILNISYYKSQGLSDQRASNIRYLSPEISRIFLLYIVLIDPFIEFLNINLLSIKKLKKTKSLVPYFFYVNNRLLESKDLSLKLNSFSSLVLGQKIGIQVYRQIIITIIKEFMLEKLNSQTLLLENDENSLNKLIALQSNHSSKVEDLNYGRNNTTFNNINSNLQFKYLQFCLRYFAFFKINSFNSEVESYKTQLKIKNNLEQSNSLNIINSLAIRYSKDNIIKDLSNSSNNKKHSRQISSINSSSFRANKKIKTLDLLNLSSLSNTTFILKDLLQDFLQDNNSNFRSQEQELLIKSFLLKVPYILGVLPTSIGKSLSYLLTSSLSISKVTIVILPLIGLKLDILRRAKTFNIPCNIFEENHEFSNLTLVSIESITEDIFITLVQSLINNNNLDRIILDECHLLITALNYRSIMFKFKELLLLSTQFVFLTGTLPLSFEKELINNLLLFDLSIIRAPCLKSNISYQVSTYKTYKEEDRINEIFVYINSFKINHFLTSQDKILIFCPSQNNVDLVASILNCSFYYSSLSNENKSTTLNNFLNSKEDYYSILVTTSALEEGFDYSFIRLVIYKDLAYSFLGFLQGSSRGGRDNNNSTSMFFYNSKDSRLSQSNFANLSLLEQDKYLVNNYLLETICRRRQISLYLDNILIEKCSYLDNLCDLCLLRNNTINNQISRIIESNKEVENNRVLIRTQIKTLAFTCIYCRLLNNIKEVDSNDHESSNCSLYKSLDLKAKEIKEIIKSKQIILRDNSCCFNCLFPTVICSHLKESENCFIVRFMYRILALYYVERVTFDFETKFSLSKSISLLQFLNIFLSKVYIKEINTEGLKVFQILAFDS